MIIYRRVSYTRPQQPCESQSTGEQPSHALVLLPLAEPESLDRRVASLRGNNLIAGWSPD